MLFANSDDDARILETKKDGRIYIPASRLDTINTMDAVIVPSGEVKIQLRSLGVKIPIFVIAAAVDVRVLNELKDSKNDLFRRYFRIGSEQKYAMSVMHVRDRKEIEEMNMLASAVPDVNFYVFVSASKTLSDRIRLKTFDKFTAKNLIVTGLIPEDVYRSGLIDASYFIDLGSEKMSVMTIYEPMYAKVPLIISKKAVISDIVDPKRAFLVKDYNGAAFVIRNNLSSEENVANAFEYTKNVNKENFTAAIFNLFQKIYSR